MLEEFMIIYKMVKIHEIEDHLLDQIKKYNGIKCFIKKFIEKSHQFGMLDKKELQILETE